jgi:hypothetical protein
MSVLLHWTDLAARMKNIKSFFTLDIKHPVQISKGGWNDSFASTIKSIEMKAEDNQVHIYMQRVKSTYPIILSGPPAQLAEILQIMASEVRKCAPHE